MRRGRRIGSLLVAIFAIFTVAVPVASAAPIVREVKLDRDIDPVTARFVVGGWQLEETPTSRFAVCSVVRHR